MRILYVALTVLPAGTPTATATAREAPQVFAEDAQAHADDTATEEGRGELRMGSFAVTESAPRIHGASYAEPIGLRLIRQLA